MAKKAERPEFDPETGEVFQEEATLVSHSEIRDQLADLKAQDTKKVFEWPDPRPMSPPLGYQPEPDLAERIRMMVRSEHLRLAAEASGDESFEEADDFDVDDDFDPSSPYEMFFDPPVVSPEASSNAQPSSVVSPDQGGGGTESPSAKPTDVA